jgi:hypothetical protein
MVLTVLQLGFGGLAGNGQEAVCGRGYHFIHDLEK